MVATVKQKTLTEKTNHSYRWRRQPHWRNSVPSTSSTESPAPGDYCLAAKKLFQQWRFQREDELEGPVPRRANYYWPLKTLVAHFFSFGSEENSNRGFLIENWNVLKKATDLTLSCFQLTLWSTIIPSVLLWCFKMPQKTLYKQVEIWKGSAVSDMWTAF